MLYFETSMVTLRAAKVGLTKVGGCLWDSNGTELVGQLEHLTASVDCTTLTVNLCMSGCRFSSNSLR